MEEIEVKETPTGRAAILERYKAANPDTEDPDDEALFGYAHDSYSDLDKRHGEMSGANSRLSELVSKDPRLGAVLSMVTGEESKSLPYAMANVYGRDWLDAEIEEFEKGYQENLARLAESEAEREQVMKNIEDYETNLKRFAEENGLDEAQAEQLHEAIYKDASDLFMGVVSPEFIAYKWKGLNYDKDVAEAADTGVVEGRNQAIEVKKKKVVANNPLPDLATGTGAGKSRVTPPKSRGSFFDEIDKNSQ